MTIWHYCQLISQKKSSAQFHLLSGVGFQYTLNATEEIQNAGYFELIEDLQAPFFILNDTSILQNGQVFRNGGHVRADHLSQLTDTFLSSGELIHDEKPGRVSHGFDDLGSKLESGLGFGIHFFLL
jgi:hypothetical protein